MHIQRGMDFNAEHANFNGHKVFGFKTEKVDKKRKYVIRPRYRAVRAIDVTKYAEGEPCSPSVTSSTRPVAGGILRCERCTGCLKNRAYIEYRHGEFVVPGLGMPALVDKETFDRAQKRIRREQAPRVPRGLRMDEDGAPRYWLTGKLYCGECGRRCKVSQASQAQGARITTTIAPPSGSCAQKVKKDWIEDLVTDVTVHHRRLGEPDVHLRLTPLCTTRTLQEAGYLESLEAKRKEVERHREPDEGNRGRCAQRLTLIERLNQRGRRHP